MEQARRAWPAALLFGFFLAVYVRTAAPSVLAGDSAEFQMAAPLLGVPHPTTYPLYILLGKLATLLVPWGDLAWRVTLVSALGAALAVAALFLAARRAFGSAVAAALGALALGCAPGLWNAATIAEVYALMAGLLATLAWLLVPREAATPPGWRRLRVAALVGGLGCTQHALFVLAGMPLLAAAVAWALVHPATRPAHARAAAAELARLALCWALGLLPYLFPLVQYARYGPFDGQDYGLPRQYFWGAPESWGAALRLLGGGGLGGGLFRLPTPGAALLVVRMLAARWWFEWGPLGTALSLLGVAVLARRARATSLGAAWVGLATLGYLLLLGPAVQDAPVFSVPMLLPGALWVAAGAAVLIEWISVRARLAGRVLAVVLVLAALGWGYTRVPFSSKRQQWVFRDFATATLAQLPPDAVVLAHWEQGMTLQYLVQAERQRPDLWIDVVEPGDDAWGARAARRYAGRAVFFLGAPADVAGLPIELRRADSYANLYELRR